MIMFCRESYTYEEIKEETSIPDRDLIRALQPISTGKQVNQKFTLI